MSVRELTARTALSPSRLAGYEWSLNPYRGCGFGCAYCYSPAILRQPRATWASELGVRRNLPTVLARELRRRAPGVVAISTITDGYQPVERRYEVTRRCLEQLVRHDWPVSLLTKSDLWLRDLDLLGRLSRVEVGLTFTTSDMKMQQRVEPAVPPPARRIAAARQATATGLPVYAFLGPLYPSETPAGVAGLVRELAAVGIGRVMVDDLHHHPGTRKALAAAGVAWGAGDYPPLFAAAREAAHECGVDFAVSELAQTRAQATERTPPPREAPSRWLTPCDAKR